MFSRQLVISPAKTKPAQAVGRHTVEQANNICLTDQERGVCVTTCVLVWTESMHAYMDKCVHARVCVCATVEVYVWKCMCVCDKVCVHVCGQGIGIGSTARQAFGHPVGVRILALPVRGDQANDTPRASTRNERPSADIVSINHLIRPSGLTISGAAKDGERVRALLLHAPYLPIYFPIRAFPPGSSPAPMALPHQH
jgi:hypothetical protein